MEPQTAVPDDLQELVHLAVDAYARAQLTKLELLQQAQEEHAAALQTLQRQQRDELAARQRRQDEELRVAQGQQTRIGHLVALAEQVTRAASSLLEDTAAEYIAQPLNDQTPATTAEFPRLFARVHTYYVELATHVLALAQARLDGAQWEEARQMVQPLLRQVDSPFTGDVRRLLCRSYYLQAQQEMAGGHWRAARQHLRQILSLDATYADTVDQLRHTHPLWRWSYALVAQIRARFAALRRS
jgi:hypothetical protein